MQQTICDVQSNDVSMAFGFLSVFVESDFCRQRQMDDSSAQTFFILKRKENFGMKL